MITKKLKAVHFVKDGNIYRVLGIYRNLGIARYDDTSEYETLVLSESAYFHREIAEARSIAEMNFGSSDMFFDSVSEPLEESLAKLKKEG